MDSSLALRKTKKRKAPKPPNPFTGEVEEDDDGEDDSDLMMPDDDVEEVRLTSFVMGQFLSDLKIFVRLSRILPIWHRRSIYNVYNATPCIIPVTEHLWFQKFPGEGPRDHLPFQ